MPTSQTPTVRQSRGFRWRGKIGVVLLVPAAAVALVSAPIIPEGSVGALVMDVIAWAAFVAGAALRFWSTLYIGGRKDAVMVTEGPYSICRNPLYLGSLLLAIAVGLFLKSLVFALALLLLTLIYMLTTVPAEEKILRAKYGQPYDDYCRRVPAYWPKVREFHTPTRIDVDLHGLWLECRRASRWVWLPLLAKALANLQAHGWWLRMLKMR